MSKLLIHEPPLVVLPSLAKEVGLSEAIVLQQLHFLGQRSSDGWVEKTLKEWQRDHFIFWHVGTVKRALTSLRNRRLVHHDQPNGPDRTARYRVDYDALDELLGDDAAGLIQGNKMRPSKSAQSDLARDDSAPFRNSKRGTTDPPQPPVGGRRRDTHRFEADCQAYGAQHFPDLGDDAGAAVSQTVRAGARTLDAVTEAIDRWWRRDGSEG